MSKNCTPVVYKANRFYKIINMAKAKKSTAKKAAPKKKAAKKAAPKKKATKSKGKK